MSATVKILGKPVGPIGYGLMGLTWRPAPQPVSDSFKAMETALSQGATLWNGGELYGTPERHSCHLLNEYFKLHPGDADKIVLSIKGGLVPGQLKPDGSAKNVRRSVEDCLKILDGTKGIDIFECARLDPDVPLEETIGALAQLVKEGKIGGIGLSEVKASTIVRANAIHPIAAVEVEVSLWTTDILRNGVAATCAKLDIPIIAYSPLSRGALAGETIRKHADIPEGDIRKHMPRFQDDVLEYNNRIVDEVEKLAAKKGVTKAQIAIAWVRSLSGRTITTENGEQITLGTIIPIPGATRLERVIENTTIVELSDEEMKEIADILKRNPVKGDRYPARGMAHTNM
ncbi:pyridoxine 4-dehydrogenase [Cladophialophora psammophila CBS 110553]|uniref:Pyridoxine 4-dehydrogenase n=1 Tax=Cladophialophora psammophila CBS 110553 TaxID=1182543 RepID=W9WU69_9EURO|nr:pyridoxine 4-dehydrogenase [Cladophialophora psammophila CBS 110553]EXJ68206.1 pyridoxine 4-dehydrogenase [Cladophialophora psammophila CBS 110553]